MNKRITIKEASEKMGVCQQFVRVGLQTGRLPFGTAVKMSSRWTYYINEDKFNEYLGQERKICIEYNEGIKS